MWRSPWMVACTTLMGFRLPSAFATTSFTPSASMTARTAPPALIPAPGCAGRSSTLDARNFVVTEYGIVEPFSVIGVMSFRAIVAPLRMASGTALPLPKPTPTWP